MGIQCMRLKVYLEHAHCRLVRVAQFCLNFWLDVYLILDSIVVSIPACHAGDRGSIPRRGGIFFEIMPKYFLMLTVHLIFSFSQLKMTKNQRQAFARKKNLYFVFVRNEKLTSNDIIAEDGR